MSGYLAAARVGDTVRIARTLTKSCALDISRDGGAAGEQLICVVFGIGVVEYVLRAQFGSRRFVVGEHVPPIVHAGLLKLQGGRCSLERSCTSLCACATATRRCLLPNSRSSRRRTLPRNILQLACGFVCW